MSIISDLQMYVWLRKLVREQSGITGLETAIVLIAFVVVAAVFAFTVLTTGLFTSEKAKETTMAGVAATSSTLSLKGTVTAIGGPVVNPADTCVAGACEYIDHIRVKVAPSGVEETAFRPENVMVTYQDDVNLELLPFFDGLGQGWIDPNNLRQDINTCRTGWNGMGPPPLPGQNLKAWCYKWGPSSGDVPDEIIEPGEIVELYIFLNNLDAADRLQINQQFRVEVVLTTGAVIKIDRTTPAVIKSTMNLD